MRQNQKHQIFCQDKKFWEKLQEQKKKEESRIIAAQIWKNCDAMLKVQMPQGKRRFDEVKTKFKEGKFWKFQDKIEV